MRIETRAAERLSADVIAFSNTYKLLYVSDGVRQDFNRYRIACLAVFEKGDVVQSKVIATGCRILVANADGCGAITSRKPVFVEICPLARGTRCGVYISEGLPIDRKLAPPWKRI